MELLSEVFGKYITSVVGAAAIIGFFILMTGTGTAVEHTFTEEEVGTVVNLTEPITVFGTEYIPAMTYEVDEIDVGKTVQLGSGLFGRTMYIVFNNMLEQE